MPEFVQVARILGAAALTVAVCWLLGDLLLARLRPLLSPIEEMALAFLVGAAMLSTLILALGVVGWVSVWAYLLLALILFALWFRFARPRYPEVRFRLRRLSWLWLALLCAVGIPFFVLYHVNAMAPEFSSDGMAYHLGLVARYAREGRIMPTPENLYSALSQGVEMLFLYAFVLGRHSAASLAQLAFLVALAALLVSFGVRHGFPGGGVAASVLVFASPIIGITATIAYVDVAVAAVAFAAVYLLTLWEKNPKLLLVLSAGLLAGFCYGSKYSAVGAVPLAGLMVLWGTRRKLFAPRTALTIGILVGGVALTAGPWLVRNAVWYGNPLAPFYNSLFPNSVVTPEFESGYRAAMGDWGQLPSKWDIPLEITVRGNRLQGFFGPLLLAAPLALLALGNTMGRRMLLAVGCLGALYYANLGSRFLIPTLPFVAMAMAIGIRRWRPALAGLAIAHAVLSWPAVAATYCDQYAPRLDQFPLRAALRIEPEDSFLASKLAEWPLIEFLNGQTSPIARVFALGALPESYIERDIVVDYYSANGERLRDVLWSAMIGDRMPTDIVELSIPAVKTHALRLGYGSPVWEPGWGVSEVSVLGGDGQPLDKATWSLRAEPNRWQARYATDGNPMTRWQTWQPMDSGMHLTITLDLEQQVTAVVLLLAPQHSWMEPVIESAADGVTWELMPREIRKTIAPPDVAAFRRDAIRALRDAGMDYLAVREGNFLFDEFRENAPAWGITEVHSSAVWNLYRLPELD